MRKTFHRKAPVVLAVAAFGLLATACDSGAGAVEDSTPTTDDHAGHALRHDAALAAPADGTDAFTYNPQLAPVGAEMAIEMAPSSGSTTFSLEVTGMRPNRGYAAHAHTDKCGVNPDASGGHYQNEPAPEGGSDKPDPEFVNPKNEFWLDFTTDAQGNGSSEVTLDFEVTDWDRPRSVVVHSAQKTSTEPGQAGASGDRVACLSLPHSH